MYVKILYQSHGSVMDPSIGNYESRGRINIVSLKNFSTKKGFPKFPTIQIMAFVVFVSFRDCVTNKTYHSDLTKTDIYKNR